MVVEYSEFELPKKSLRYSHLDDELLFDLLVKYHCEINLSRWLNHAQINNDEYKIITKSGFQLSEGFSENKFTRGVLMLATDTDLTDRLVTDRVIVDEGLIDERLDWKPFDNERDLLNHIELTETPDASYVVDKRKNKILTIHEFNNSRRLEKSFLHYIPSDFLSFKEKIDITGTGATKTKNAIRAAVYYDGVTTFQIKATSYANSGIGKVAYFDKLGLVKEFFILYHPLSTARFIDDKWGLIGILREYRDSNGNPTYEDGRIIPVKTFVVDKTLKKLKEVDTEYIKRTIYGR